MTITINGSGTVTGISVGGLPDGIVDAGTLASNSVETAKLADSAVTDAKAHIAGSVIQVVYAKYDTAFVSTTTHVDTGLSATINVHHASSTLVINCSALWANNSNSAYMYLSDGSDNIIDRPGASGDRGRFHWGSTYFHGDYVKYNANRDTFQCTVTPGSTGNYTVKLRGYNHSSTEANCVHLNRNQYNGDRIYDPIGVSTLTIMEVAA